MLNRDERKRWTYRVSRASLEEKREEKEEKEGGEEGDEEGEEEKEDARRGQVAGLSFWILVKEFKFHIYSRPVIVAAPGRKVYHLIYVPNSAQLDYPS